MQINNLNEVAHVNTHTIIEYIKYNKNLFSFDETDLRSIIPLPHKAAITGASTCCNTGGSVNNAWNHCGLGGYSAPVVTETQSRQYGKCDVNWVGWVWDALDV